MKKYLLDTNIAIFFLKGQFNLFDKIKKVGLSNCFVSEITIAELKYGAEKSMQIEKRRKEVIGFENLFQTIPIYSSLDVYAIEKARLRKEGQIVDDFDLLIGATAIENNLVMVTNNTRHFKRLKNIIIQDWTVE